MRSRLRRASSVAAALLAVLAVGGAAAQPPQKVFRYAFEVAETSFDPHRISDVYSNIVNQAMFDAPLTYDYLAQPAKLKPNTAVSLPEVSADGLTYTIRIKPGIYFIDDPAFNGRKRELVAADYVYALKLTSRVNPARSTTLVSKAFAVGTPGPAKKAKTKTK